MEASRRPIFLSQREIKLKFEQLGVLALLNKTCVPRKIKPAKHIPSFSLQRQRHTGWRGENFLHKKDGKSRAIIYWRKMPNGEEEYTVEQFTAPDGTFYTSDAITSFEPQSVIMKADENTPSD